MKGIILAAGDGDRLGVLTLGYPKALLDVDGWPLIGYALTSQAMAGIEEIAIVVGHLGDRIREALGDGSQFGVKLSYIVNNDYLGGNAVSVHKAREWVQGEPVVLCMADHVIAERLVKRLVENSLVGETLCIDRSPGEHVDIGEATKIVLDDDGCIRQIGKGLVRWDALDTGVFQLTSCFFDAVDKLVRRHGVGVELSDVVRFLVGDGNRFGTCDISGCFWMDVDTKADLDMVRGIR